MAAIRLRLGYRSAKAWLRLGSRGSAAARRWQRCEKLMRSAATVGDGGGYGDDGEATTLIGRKMSPIAPSACHARTYTIWSLCTACDEVLCDEMLHRWTLHRLLVRWLCHCTIRSDWRCG